MPPPSLVTHHVKTAASGFFAEETDGCLRNTLECSVEARDEHHADDRRHQHAPEGRNTDRLPAARPGARRESAEAYIKRLEKLEEISNSHRGVERTYAMQAGREIRVMVKPEEISDAESVVLAHDIATEIEEKMEYPGQVKVVVIRESRATDIAK